MYYPVEIHNILFDMMIFLKRKRSMHLYKNWALKTDGQESIEHTNVTVQNKSLTEHDNVTVQNRRIHKTSKVSGTGDVQIKWYKVDVITSYYLNMASRGLRQNSLDTEQNCVYRQTTLWNQYSPLNFVAMV